MLTESVFVGYRNGLSRIWPSFRPIRKSREVDKFPSHGEHSVSLGEPVGFSMVDMGIVSAL